jgi:hypothetical protein
MHEGTASSFGDGEEQWEGIDLTDPGARMSMRLDMGGRVRVEVTIPVDVVPPGYWLSPFAVEGIMTWDLGGFNMHGEAMWWGMLFGRETCPL